MITGLESCRICPRECGADRYSGPSGYCRADAGYNIASICIHRGEEPVISGESGICNIFFSGCNMRCVYCQNHEISRGSESVIPAFMTKDNILAKIGELLARGVKAVGFVSPSHVIPQVLSIIEGMESRGLSPVKVFNTGGYDKVETIRMLDGIIDVYLPDFKYCSNELAHEFSDARDYPEVALKALKEMYFQKGSVLQTDDSGQVVNGMLIRHLVLPGHAEESKNVLRIIADELSTGVHISLMSQYHPAGGVGGHALLGRTLYRKEYESVAEEMEKLGFRNGYFQDMDSNLNYRPDFRRHNPFE